MAIGPPEYSARGNQHQHAPGRRGGVSQASQSVTAPVRVVRWASIRWLACNAEVRASEELRPSSAVDLICTVVGSTGLLQIYVHPPVAHVVRPDHSHHKRTVLDGAVRPERAVLLDNRRDELVFERQPKVVQDAPACSPLS